MLEGVDVSHHNGSISWSRVRAAGVTFTFVKATEGATFVDPRCTANLAGCRAAGIAPGAYHFYHHDVDPAAQAAHFLQTIGQPETGDLPPALDIEAPGDGAGSIKYPTAEVVNRIGEFVRAVERQLGRAPFIYTYPSAWVETTGNSNAFASICPLWIASYTASPKIPGGWTEYTVWQYTDRGSVAGIATIVDRDRMSDGVSELDALRHQPLAIGSMALVTQDANVREAPGVTAKVLAVLPGGTGVVIVDGPEMLKDRAWWKVDDGEGVVGWCSSKLLTPG
jgi:GH25 family lysozyme M1 (1,4-beta-N-acetylmuramidase)